MDKNRVRQEVSARTSQLVRINGCLDYLEVDREFFTEIQYGDLKSKYLEVKSILQGQIADCRKGLEE